MPGSNRCSAHLRRVGRPVSFTAAVADQIVGVVASGVQLSTALSIVGVPRSTYYDWIERRESMFMDFAKRVEAARAQGQAQLVLEIVRASRTEWRAAALLLEQIAPQRWAPLPDRPAGDEEPWPDG